MTKLHYVVSGGVVEFAYTISLFLEAKLKGCNILSYQPNYNPKANYDHEYGDAGVINRIIKWLIENYPDKYSLE